MIIVWLITVVLAVCFLVVAFGSGLLRFFATAFVVVSTPVREIARLYKSNHKKKAYTLAASMVFALIIVPFIIWLLSIIVP